MKIKSLAAICKRRKSIVLFHAGNGRAFAIVERGRRGILQSALRKADRRMGQKGLHRSDAGGYDVVLLIPARTDTAYFHDFIYRKAEIRFIRGRLKFTDEEGNAKQSAPFPSMLVIYRGSGSPHE